MPPLFARILVDNWHLLLLRPWAEIALVLVSAICGAIVGGERERREKPAGLRTLMLVCLGSALFTMVGFAFTTTTGDSGRVAAQIVTGIGFLGAGVILHGRGTISGTTTAATIWVTAAIGMLTAAGYAGGALGVSLLVRLLLFTAGKFEAHRFGRLPLTDIAIDFAPAGGKTRVRIERVLVDFRGGTVASEWSAPAGQREWVTLKLRLPQHHLCELLGELAEISEVLTIDRAPIGSTHRPA
jgi:putative Mg2+ transporter-C (MgtC) family protein